MQDEEVLQYYERRQKITGNKKAEWMEYQSAVTSVLAMGYRDGDIFGKLLSQIRCKKPDPILLRR